MLLMSLMLHPARTCPYAGRGWGIEHGERFVPSILGSQQVLHYLAHRAVATASSGHETSNRAHFGGSIVHRHRVAARAHCRKIRQIITNERHRGERNAARVRCIADVIKFVLAPGIQVANAEFLKPVPDCKPGPTSDHRDLATKALP